MSLLHLPTLLLLIGYPIFWLEVYFSQIPYGRTSPLALILFLSAGLFIAFQSRKTIAKFLDSLAQGYKNQSPLNKFFLAAGTILSIFTFLCAFYAALLPPHLMQEWDSLHYHMSLPRQHLIQHSFGFLSWAADDLFPLPLEFALAPFWFVTTLPNKFPQFLFFCGLVAVSASLVSRQNKNDLLKLALIVFAVFASHNIGIQMGTAMMDLVICYLFLAAIDSFLNGKLFLGAVELTFFFWSKSFIPLQMGVIVVVGAVVIFLLRRFYGHQMTMFLTGRKMTFDQSLRHGVAKAAVYFVLLSMAVALPFLLKSLHFAATPLYPFNPGVLPIYGPIDPQSPLLKASEMWMTTVKDQYGYGYSFPAFLKHLWLIAVPEDGVNNTYDYPVGLVYLIFLGPFLYLTVQAVLEKKSSLVSLFVVFFWATWWMGSHQSRFLYIPIMLIIITVLSDTRINTRSPVLMVVVMLALVLNALSVLRAHKHNFGVPWEEVLRPEDKEMVRLSRDYIRKDRKDIVLLESRHVLYAQFPVVVTKQKLPHTLGASL